MVEYHSDIDAIVWHLGALAVTGAVYYTVHPYPFWLKFTRHTCQCHTPKGLQLPKSNENPTHSKYPQNMEMKPEMKCVMNFVMKKTGKKS